MNITAIFMTAIICVTIVAICWITRDSGNGKGGTT